MTEEHAAELEALAAIAAEAADHAQMAATYESSRGFAMIGYLEVIAAAVTALLKHTYEDGERTPAPPQGVGRCPDCGEEGERKGHMTCQYPQN